jgi:hypothetical protein
MKQTRRSFPRWRLYLVISLALITASACNSSPASGAREATTAAAPNDGRNQIDVMCIGDRVSSPPESFHYSFRYNDESTSVDKEADITPQAIDTTIKDKSGSIPATVRAPMKPVGATRSWTFQART